MYPAYQKDWDVKRHWKDTPRVPRKLTVGEWLHIQRESVLLINVSCIRKEAKGTIPLYLLSAVPYRKGYDKAKWGAS